MSKRGRSEIAKMLSSALKGIRRGEPQRTIAWIKQELVGATRIKTGLLGSASVAKEGGGKTCSTDHLGSKNAVKEAGADTSSTDRLGSANAVNEASAKTSSTAEESTLKALTRSRKLLAPEEPEVLRPHCADCACGGSLRPGLDCRCHCPQCTTGKPRCSSPRMALRREEVKTCETFVTKHAKTSKPTTGSSAVNRSRRTASFDIISATPQPPKHASRAATKGQITADVEARKDSGFSNQGVPTISSYSDQATRCATSEKTQSTDILESKKPELADPVVKLSEGSSNLMSAPSTVTKCCQSQSPPRERTGSAEAVTKQVRKKDQCDELETPLATQLPSRSGSKRARCGALKVDSRARCGDSTTICESCTATTKYGLWSEAGRLRALEVRCYCDPCMGLKSATCSSPRIAELKNPKGRNASQGPRGTTSVRDQ